MVEQQNNSNNVDTLSSSSSLSLQPQPQPQPQQQQQQLTKRSSANVQSTIPRTVRDLIRKSEDNDEQNRSSSSSSSSDNKATIPLPPPPSPSPTTTTTTTTTTTNSPQPQQQKKGGEKASWKTRLKLFITHKKSKKKKNNNNNKKKSNAVGTSNNNNNSFSSNDNNNSSGGSYNNNNNDDDDNSSDDDDDDDENDFEESSKEQPQSDILAKIDWYSMNTILRIDATRDIFREYLISQHCEETILFWDRVLRYRKIMTNEERYEEAEKIVDEFLKQNARYQINISDREKQRALEKLEAVRKAREKAQKNEEAAGKKESEEMGNMSMHDFFRMAQEEEQQEDFCPANLFDQVARANHHLMKSDCFARLRSSDKWQQIIDVIEAVKQETLADPTERVPASPSSPNHHHHSSSSSGGHHSPLSSLFRTRSGSSYPERKKSTTTTTTSNNGAASAPPSSPTSPSSKMHKRTSSSSSSHHSNKELIRRSSMNRIKGAQQRDTSRDSIASLDSISSTNLV